MKDCRLFWKIIDVSLPHLHKQRDDELHTIGQYSFLFSGLIIQVRVCFLLTQEDEPWETEEVGVDVVVIVAPCVGVTNQVIHIQLADQVTNY